MDIKPWCVSHQGFLVVLAVILFLYHLQNLVGKVKILITSFFVRRNFSKRNKT